MIRLYNKLKERLEVIEHVYDVIRVVNPADKDIISIKNDKIERLKGRCYHFWNKDMSCENCISNRAYIENSAFAKIERHGNNLIFVIAIPILADGNRYVVEMLKNIDQKGKTFNINNDAIVKKFDGKIAGNELIDFLNDFYESEMKKIDIEKENDFIEIDDVKLSALEKKIDKLRDSLNKLCELPDKIGKDKEILNASQALDKLIVEYMKGI